MKCVKVLVFIILLMICSVNGYVWQSIIPPPRNMARMVIDSVNQRVILFGGSGLNCHWYNDLWQMPLSDSSSFYWLQIRTSGTIPSGRGGCAFVYVPNQQKTYAICGDTFGNTGGLENEVWALRLTRSAKSWQQLFPSGTPPVGRRQIEGIYHPGRNSIIFYCGEGQNYNYFDEVWELKLEPLSWHLITISGSRPLARYGYGLAFDQNNNRMILFGGGKADGTFSNEVWALDLTVGSEHWTRLYPSGTSPVGRAGFAHGYNPYTNKLYIFGGWNYTGGYLFDDAFVLDIANMMWMQINAAGVGPFERRNACGTFDYFNNNFIVVGGDDGATQIGDCYILDIDNSSASNPEWKPSLYLTLSPTIYISSSPGDVRIHYILPAATKINIDILDISGRIVNNIFSGKTDLATGLISWDKKDIHNRQISAGTYFCRLATDEMSVTKKFVVVK